MRPGESQPVEAGVPASSSPVLTAVLCPAAMRPAATSPMTANPALAPPPETSEAFSAPEPGESELTPDGAASEAFSGTRSAAMRTVCSQNRPEIAPVQPESPPPRLRAVLFATCLIDSLCPDAGKVASRSTRR